MNKLPLRLHWKINFTLVWWYEVDLLKTPSGYWYWKLFHCEWGTDEWQSNKHKKWLRFCHLKTKEWVNSNQSQEKHGPFRPMKYSPDLRWALFEMYEQHLTFNGQVDMMSWMFNQIFCHIEMIKFHQQHWKFYHPSTRTPLITLLSLNMTLC